MSCCGITGSSTWRRRRISWQNVQDRKGELEKLLASAAESSQTLPYFRSGAHRADKEADNKN